MPPHLVFLPHAFSSRTANDFGDIILLNVSINRVKYSAASLLFLLHLVASLQCVVRIFYLLFAFLSFRINSVKDYIPDDYTYTGTSPSRNTMLISFFGITVRGDK